MTLGLPKVWVEEIRNRVKGLGELENEEQTWAELQKRVEFSSSFDRKAFEYAWRIIWGEDKEKATQGLPENARQRVDTYINETQKLATEKASEKE